MNFLKIIKINNECEKWGIKMHSKYCVIKCPFCGKERPYPISRNVYQPLENIFIASELWLTLGEHAFYCVGSNLDGKAIEKALKDCKIIEATIPEEEIRKEPWRRWNLC